MGAELGVVKKAGVTPAQWVIERAGDCGTGAWGRWCTGSLANHDKQWAFILIAIGKLSGGYGLINTL